MPWTRARPPKLHHLTAPNKRRPRRRVKSADAALNHRRRLGPVDRRFGLVDLAGVGHTFGGLRLPGQVAGFESVQRLNDQRCADHGQAQVQHRRAVVRPDRRDLFEQHRTGVEAGVHLHDRDPRRCVAGFDGTLDRRGAAPSRQQRGVDVQAAQARQSQYPLRQDQAVGGHHHHVGRGGIKRFPGGRGGVGELAVQAQAARLGQRQPQVQSQPFDRRRMQLQAASSGPIGLGQHQGDRESGRMQRSQRRGREIRRAGKNNPHDRPQARLRRAATRARA